MRVGRLEPELADALLDRHPLDQVALDPGGDVVAVADRLGGRGLGERVDAERLAHRIDRGAELGAADRVADPQPGEPVDLGEGPQQDEVGEVAAQVEAGVGVVVELELDVGLVDDHRDVARDPLEELGDPRRRHVGPGRVVRIADDHQLGRGGDLGGDRVEVVDVALAERHADLASAGERREVGVDRERRPGVDELGARLAERQRRGEQDLAGAVGERDAGGLDLVALGDPAPQQAGARVRVAVGGRGGARDRLDDAGCGPNGDSFEASWAIPSSAIDSGALPAGAPAT